jgi:hypothetical protein
MDYNKTRGMRKPYNGAMRFGHVPVLCALVASWSTDEYQINTLTALQQSEANARRAKRGPWSEPGAVPPWEWKKAK